MEFSDTIQNRGTYVFNFTLIHNDVMEGNMSQYLIYGSKCRKKENIMKTFLIT